MLQIISDVNSSTKFPCKQTIELCLSMLCFLRRMSNQIQIDFPDISENLNSVNNMIDIIGSKYDNVVQDYLIVFFM